MEQLNIFDFIEDIDTNDLNDCLTRTKKGDLYVLGEHKLLCGDCTKKYNYEKLMKEKKADLVFADPPYGLKKEKEGVVVKTPEEALQGARDIIAEIVSDEPRYRTWIRNYFMREANLKCEVKDATLDEKVYMKCIMNMLNL